MRRRNRPANHLHQPPSPRSAATGQPVYDWTRFGRHRLRAPDAVIVDLPVPVAAARQVWVATVWPDSRVAGGWARLAWEVDQDTQRGWRLPMQLAAGDVLEFGADTPTPAGAVVRDHGLLPVRPVGDRPRPLPAPGRGVGRRTATSRPGTVPASPRIRTGDGAGTVPSEPPRSSEATAPTPVVGRQAHASDRPSRQAAGAERGSQTRIDSQIITNGVHGVGAGLGSERGSSPGSVRAHRRRCVEHRQAARRPGGVHAGGGRRVVGRLLHRSRRGVGQMGGCWGGAALPVG